MEKTKAFEIVYKELKKVPMFTGKYDALNGSKDFMCGICTVMEYITGEINEPTYEEFSTRWIANVLDSFAKANERKENK